MESKNTVNISQLSSFFCGYTTNIKIRFSDIQQIKMVITYHTLIEKGEQHIVKKLIKTNQKYICSHLKIEVTL